MKYAAAEKVENENGKVRWSAIIRDSAGVWRDEVRCGDLISYRWKSEPNDIYPLAPCRSEKAAIRAAKRELRRRSKEYRKNTWRYVS